MVVKTTNETTGLITTNEYDKLGNLVKTSDNGGKTVTNKYDVFGQVIESTDEYGRTSKTEYDKYGQVTKEISATNEVTVSQYDKYGNVTKVTTPLGSSTVSTYDLLNRKLTDTLDEKKTLTYSYDAKGQMISTHDSFTDKTDLSKYDGMGQVIETTDKLGNVSKTDYDAKGQVIKLTDALGHESTKEYDLYGNVIKETNALGYATEYEYDIYGNTTKETFVDHVTVNTYDIDSNLIKTVENTDKITTHEYDVLGRELKQVQNGKDMLVQSYDAVGNVTSKTEKGVTVQYAYDALGQITEHKYPSLNNADEFKAIVNIKYDESGNQIEFKDIYDNVLKRGYDANNNVISETNTRGFTTKYEYDSLSNITKVQSPLERVVKYEYDGNNNMLKRIYNDKEALYTYDENNNLINEISEYGLKESYSYDADGNLTSLTKNDGTEIKYSYDALGRKLTEGSRTFEYDPYDNVTKATYNKKSIEYTYDKFNNIIKVDDANDNIVEYKWDIYGNRTELKYKDNTVNYTYNQFDKIDKVVKNGNDYATYSYDVRGNTASVVCNGITTNYSYDELNRRTDYVNKKGDETLSTYKYAYDGENNIISETINGVKNTYTYNESDELKTSSKTIDGKVINTEYKYDIFGNKIESSSDGTAKVYRYNDKNQLTSVKNQEGLTDIYYDKNGNIRDIYYAGGYKEYYEYDEFDQLTTLKSNKDRSWNYEYDAEGDRIHEEKIVHNRYSLDYEKDSAEWYDYVQTLPFEEVKQLLAEKDSKETFDALRYQLKYRKQKGLCVSNLAKDADANSEDCTYTDYTLDKTVEDALILSSGDDFNIYGEERLSTESDDERLTYIGSLNQSVMQTVKDDLKKENPKQTLSTLEYDDAGNTLDITSGFGYNGEKLDETGNIYLRARYYNPRIGQFIQIDSNRGERNSIASQQRYTYVANNQYKYIDRNGNSFALSLGGIFGGIVAAVKSVSVAAVVATTGWLAVGAVVIGAVGYGIYSYSNSRTKPISTTLPYNPTNENTNKKDKTNDKDKTGGKTKPITGGQPGTRTIPRQPTRPSLKIPKPCPDGFGWEQIPKHIVSLIIGLYGAQAWVNEFLGKLERIKHHPTYQIHHIVAQKAWDECGRVQHDFYLNVPREVLKNNLDEGVDSRENKVSIINTLHRCIHTKLYYWSIKINFNGSLKAKSPANKAIIISRLNAYRVILTDLSNKVAAFFK